MRLLSRLIATFLLLICTAWGDEGHHHSLTEEEIGSVQFATSCSPQVAVAFNRAVALLHSFQSRIPTARWLIGAWPCRIITVCGVTAI